MTPIIAIGAKVLEPMANAIADAINPQSVPQNSQPGFHKELLKQTGRLAGFASPVDHELLALCSLERQKEFGQAILGKTVQVCDPKGQIISGRVDDISIQDGRLNLQIGGQTFRVADLRAVYQDPPTSLREMAPQQGVAK